MASAALITDTSLVEGVDKDDEEQEEAHPEQVDWKDGIYADVIRKPSYYRESSFILRCFKVVIFGGLAVAPYYLVLDQVAHIADSDFVPCTKYGCSYMRIFGDSWLPGSGVGFVSVMNGVKRPIGLQIYPDIKPYSVCKSGTIHFDPNNEYFKEDESTKKALETYIEDSEHYFSSFTKLALKITKIPVWICLTPISFLASLLEPWGMENIKSALCPGMNSTAMEERCEKTEVKKHIHNHMRHGLSRYLVTVFVALWMVFTITHDLMLLSDKFDDDVSKPLYVAAVATVCQGIACAALFSWSMAATEVFAADASLDGSGDCACYYRLPPLASLFSMATPFGLLFAWAARLQLLAMASLYGDYLYNTMYIVPHHLTKQTLLWTWGVLISAKVPGTRQSAHQNWYERIMNTNPKTFDNLYLMMKGMYILRFIILMMVYVFSAPFVVRAKELLVDETRNLEGIVQFFAAFVIQPMPSIAILVVYVWIFSTFRDHVMNKDMLKVMLDREVKTPYAVKMAVFVTMITLLGVLVLASSEGLFPNLEYILEPTHAQHPTLMHSEVWGSCGFIFCYVVISQVTHEIFLLHEEINMLRKVGDWQITYRQSIGGTVSTEKKALIPTQDAEGNVVMETDPDKIDA